MSLLDWLFRGITNEREKEQAVGRIREVDREAERLERILESETEESIRLEREGRRWRSSGAGGAR